MPSYYHFNDQGEFLGMKDLPSSDELLRMPERDILVHSGFCVATYRSFWMRSSSMDLHDSWPQVFPYNFEKDIFNKICSTLMVLGADKLPSYYQQ